MYFDKRVREKPNKRRIKPERIGRDLYLDPSIQLQIMRDPRIMNKWLHSAIWEKDTFQVKNLIKMGVNVNTLDSLGITPISNAIRLNRVKIAQFLLTRQNVDICFEDYYGRSLLMIAIHNKNMFMVVKLLIQNGADLNETDKEGCSPLHIAIRLKHTAIVKLLIQNGADLTKTDHKGYFPLNLAILHRQPAMVKLLLENDANPNSLNPDKTSLLYWQIVLGSYEIFSLLVDHKVKLDIEVERYDFSKCSLLHFAIYNKKQEFSKKLIENGAELNISDSLGQHPLHLACKTGQVDVVKILLKHNTNVNARNHEMKTPLHLAAYYGHEIIVEILMKNGANIEAEDHRNNRAIHLATFNGHASCLKMLIKWGAKLECKNLPDKTPLQIALLTNHLIPLHIIKSHYPEGLVKKINQETIFELALNNRTLINAFKVLVYNQF